MFTAGIEVRDEMGRRQKLKTLCETRWASRSYSLFTFLSAISVVCSSFGELEHGRDAKTMSYLCHITKSDFIVCLVAVQSILQPVVSLSLSATLQTKRLWSNPSCRWENKTVIDLLQGERRVNWVGPAIWSSSWISQPKTPYPKPYSQQIQIITLVCMHV